ncbi:MAG: NAD(P)/FAD-dependent oxidoreductase [Nitrospinota bacterium]
MDINKPLGNGSKIAVIGGGPAGSFFTILTKKMAREQNKDIEISIFDKKDFFEPGPTGCNMCAGVLQDNLIRQLEEVGIDVDSISEEYIQGYALCIKDICTALKVKEGVKICTIFRGGGPANFMISRGRKSFDRLLLSHAEKLGAHYIPERVKSVELSKERVRVNYGNKGGYYDADLLVGAFGVNTGVVKNIFPGYSPPRTWHVCQTELPLGRDWIKNKFFNMIHVFFLKPRGIKLLAATPKGDCLTITGLGKDVAFGDLKNVLLASEISNYIPEKLDIACHCHPKIPISPPKKPYSDRVVIIGDASYSRYLKNGIESAFITAQYAAETIINIGISDKILKENYDRRCRQRFLYDNLYGKFILYLHDFIMTNNLLSSTYLTLVNREQSSPYRKKRLSEILLHIYTGDIPYRSIFFKSLDPVLQFQLTLQTLRILVGDINKIFKFSTSNEQRLN